MLRAGLESEFPGVAEFVHRLWPVHVARDTWLWAGLVGLGVTYVASAFLEVLLVALRNATSGTAARDAIAYADSTVWIIVVALGVAVSWRAAGYRAVAVYVVVQLLTTAAGLPGVLLFCERSGEANCLGRLALGQWQAAVGLIVAVPLAVSLRSGPPAVNGVLRGAGTFAALQRLVVLPIGFLVPSQAAPLAPDGVSPLMTYFFVTAILAAAAAGIVVGRFRASARSAGILAAIILVAGVPSVIANLGAASAPYVWMQRLGVGTPVSEVLAFLVGYAAMSTRVGPRQRSRL